MNTEAMKRMIAVRTTLVLDQPFWGTLALQLQLQEDPTCETAWVDGRTLGFNPTFVTALLSTAQTVALYAHEVAHCALGHPWRRSGREDGLWNEACDRAINPMLRDTGFHLPDGALLELDPSHKGKSAEWIYNRLPHPQPGRGDGDCDACGGTGCKADEQGEPVPEDCPDCGGSGKQPTPDAAPPSFGEVRDAPTADADAPKEEDAIPSEEQWKQVVQQAAQLAAGQGKLPGGLVRLAEEAIEARVDWRSVTRRFVQEITRSDYSWSRPNPRYLAHGLYLPALRSLELGPLAIAIDTSGSIDSTLLAIFGGELQGVVEETQPRRVYVLYCDAKVQRVDVFERGDPITLHPKGGGGTDFRPVFDALPDLEEPPVCVIYLTDLRGTFPVRENEIPTLWVTPKRYTQYAVPFGEVVVLDE